jgi:hypothetical protein
VIRINDQQYWLYAAVDPETNVFLHIRLFSTYTTGLNEIFLRELREKHDVDDVPRTACSSRVLARCVLRTPCFSSMTPPGSKQPCNDTASISDTNAMEIGIALNVFSQR